MKMTDEYESTVEILEKLQDFNVLHGAERNDKYVEEVLPYTIVLGWAQMKEYGGLMSVYAGEARLIAYRDNKGYCVMWTFCMRAPVLLRSSVGRTKHPNKCAANQRDSV